MATSAAIQEIGQSLLDRDFGADGLAYWSAEYDKAQADAIAAGKTPEQAAQIANTAVRRNVARSSEAKGVAGVPDWFQHQDHDVALGVRPEDWSTKLQTSNLENYLDHQNYSYGMLQGNTVGQEGSEWWGYQTTQDIQSHLAQGKSWDEAYKAATDQVTSDISANTGHQNYKKFGTIGYGNPLQIKTSTDPSGDILTEKRYLNLHAKAIADGMGLGGGSKTATLYELDDDGNVKLDDDGNQIVATDDDGNPITGTPYQWSYVPDDSAPGGYRIEPIPFNTGTQTSTTGHDFYMANYQKDGLFVPGGGGANPFSIPPNVQNVDATQFTSGGADKLDLAQWAETPGGKSSIAAGNFDVKNKWFRPGADGNLYSTAAAIDHSTTDSNLGIAAGDTANIDWGEGWQTTLSGGPKTSNYVPPEEQAMGGAGGGGNTIINLDTNQKSTTAADKLVKRDERTAYSGAGRKGFSTLKYKPTGNISTLGIV
tara:strand:- start:171 stop:1616 length:1446 start_codon:yes stop_codon:yes gene_type:complete